jgi:regulation of enolase protein 1 (concanavalin A-like superfamily)
MNELLLDELFDSPTFDPRLNWYNPPSKWHMRDSCLVIEPDAKTDYWQKTHYGFVADNGHFLFADVTGDGIITTKVRFHPVNQYDQAGLMVRFSPQCWLKTSVEYEPDEPNKLGAVVTNYGYSDWSTQNFSDTCSELMLRIRREGSDYFVEYSLPEAQQKGESERNWTQIRMAHLHEGNGERPVQCGIYACSPIEAGYRAEFEFLKIEKGRVSSD